MNDAERDEDAPASDDEPALEDASGTEESPATDEEDEFARVVAEAERELPALPPPPKWQRQLTLGVMAVTTMVCVLLAWSLRGAALYSLSASEPLDLGDLRAASLSQGHANRYVRGYANLEPSPVVQYDRTAESDRFRLLPVAGASGVWVEHRVPRGLSGPRFLAPSRVTGRLVPIDQLGLRHRGVADALGQQGQPERPAGRWLLLEGVDPQSQRWVLALALMLAAFAGWNVWGIARILRRQGAA